MTTQVDPIPRSGSRSLPLLLLLFMGSGCAALIYEIVWFQMLELVVGSSALSLGVLLGTFMGGMCLGSLLLPRLISQGTHPLRVYGMLELAIGLSGILVLIAVPLVGGVYAQYVGRGFAGIAFRALVCGLCLLPPTLMMGATLPAISRWSESTREGIAWLGFFYAGNIAGAVFGCLFAGFYLLREFNMIAATFVAVAINAVIGWGGLRISRREPYDHTGPLAGTASPKFAKAAAPVYVAIALSGLSALGAEVVWTRLLSLALGPTVYTFSIILAVFLIGLGAGSSAGSFLERRTETPRLALAICQLLLVGGIIWAAWAIVYTVPYWPIDPAVTAADPWHAFQIDLLRCLWAIFPAALLWGASFPLALASVSPRRGDDPGRLVGGVYAANTLGAIIGSLVFSSVVIPWIGSRQAERLLIVVSAVAALLMFAQRGSRQGGERRRNPFLTGGIAAVCAAIAVGAVSIVPATPGLLVAYGREFAIWSKSPPAVRYVGEGINSSVAVTEWPSGVRNFHVAGKIEASSANRDMRLERMLGHLSALTHSQPQSVLVVGFGAGVTAGTFVLHPGIKRIVICEIEPLIPKVVSEYFGKENYNVLKDPRVEVVYDDARHYILTTKEKFDIITSDPIHPWVKGAATLYTTEYFETVKKHLNPGGVVTQWVPLYDSTEDVVKSEFATFFNSFVNGTVWSSDIRGRGYDVVLIGQNGPTRFDLDAFARRIDRPEYARVAASLEEVAFTPPMSILATYAGRAQDLRPWLEDAQLNTDRNLRLQFLAGLDVNLNDSDRIYAHILSYRKFPEDIFVGSAWMRESLRLALMP